MIIVTTVIIAILIAAAVAQPTQERRYAALLFSGFAALHHVVMFDTDGFEYYFSAALLDYFVILFTIRIAMLSEMIEKLHNICIVSIALNFIGWLMWIYYVPPHAYNASFIGLYLYALIIMIKKEKKDAGGYDSVHFWQHHFFSFFSKSYHHSNKH